MTSRVARGHLPSRRASLPLPIVAFTQNQQEHYFAGRRWSDNLSYYSRYDTTITEIAIPLCLSDFRVSD